LAFGGGGLTQPLGAVGLTPIGNAPGGRFVARDEEGGIFITTRQGAPISPSRLIPAGARLPGGATIVSISPNGQLIGIRIKRARKQFASEARKVRDIIGICRQIERATKPPKRRS